MARKPIETDDFEDHEREEFDSPQPETEPEYSEVRLASVLEEISGTNAEVKIYRAHKMDGRGGSYLFTLPADEVDLTQIQDMLRDEYGGGQFRIQVRRDGRLLANRALTVESPRKRPNQETSGLAEVLAGIQESTRAQMDLLRDQMARQSQELMRYQLEAARAQSDLMARLFESSQTSRGNQPDTLEMLLKAKELIAPPAPEKGDALEMFFRGLELGRDMGGDSDALSTAIRTFGGSLAQMVPQSPPGGSTGQPPPRSNISTSRSAQSPQLGSAQGQSPNAQPAPQPETEMTRMSDLLPYINLLLKGARDRSDASAYAIMIMDAVPESILRAWIVPDAQYRQLVNHPIAAPYGDWLDEVRGYVLDYLQDLTDAMNDDGTDSLPDDHQGERAGGDSANPGAHAPAGGPVQGESGGP